MKKLYTMVSSGKFKGKKLLLPSLETTRSTKAIVRGSFFDSFRYEIRGKIFIEAFGGSALMAAEALSNDAFRAIAVELDKDAYKIALTNAKNISENLEVVNADTFKITPEIVAKQNLPVILYLDPPFNVRDGFEDIYEKCLKMIKSLNKEKIFLLAIEHIGSLKLPEKIGEFSLLKSKRFGNTALSYYS